MTSPIWFTLTGKKRWCWGRQKSMRDAGIYEMACNPTWAFWFEAQSLISEKPRAKIHQISPGKSDKTLRIIHREGILSGMYRKNALHSKLFANLTHRLGYLGNLSMLTVETIDSPTKVRYQLNLSTPLNRIMETILTNQPHIVDQMLDTK